MAEIKCEVKHVLFQGKGTVPAIHTEVLIFYEGKHYYSRLPYAVGLGMEPQMIAQFKQRQARWREQQ